MTDSEILAACCWNDEATRFGHARGPFRQGDFICATDERILVIRPATLEDAATPEHAKPDVVGLLAKEGFLADACTLALPGLERAEQLCGDDCRDGKRPVLVTCAVCDGDGDHQCDGCNAEHECGKCHGSGKVEAGREPCPTCQATGKIMAPENMVLGPAVIGGKYAEILTRIGGVTYRLPTAEMAAVHFRSGVYSILVMPKRVRIMKLLARVAENLGGGHDHTCCRDCDKPKDCHCGCARQADDPKCATPKEAHEVECSFCQRFRAKKENCAACSDRGIRCPDCIHRPEPLTEEFCNTSKDGREWRQLPEQEVQNV